MGLDLSQHSESAYVLSSDYEELSSGVGIPHAGWSESADQKRLRIEGQIESINGSVDEITWSDTVSDFLDRVIRVSSLAEF